MRTGDGYEYFSILQAWFDHGSPDLRPEDVERLRPLLARSGIPPADDPGAGFFESPRNHKLYCWHFFAYPLLAIPAKAMLHLVGGNELAALQVTNAILLIAALYVLLFRCRAAPLRKRLAVAAFATISPVLWYLPWTHPEVFTWAMVLVAIAFLDEDRHPRAALFAALGALQNPPVALLALGIVVVSLRRGSWSHSLQTLAAAAVCLVAPLFYLLLFGHGSLVASHGFAASSLLSMKRTVSFFVDLNQGMLPYVPALVVGAAVAVFQAIARRQIEMLAVALATLAMILACETTPNWNMGAAGLIRYAVWMLPIFAWMVSDLSPRFLAAGLALHGVIAVGGSSQEKYLEQRAVAAFVLTHAPSLYDPEFEVFAERQLRWEDDPGRVDWTAGLAQDLPIPYVGARGAVTKVLVDAAHLDKLAACLRVEASYLAKLKSTQRRGLFYLDPPSAAIELPRRAADVGSPLELAVAQTELVVEQPLLRATVEVRNRGTECFWSRRPGEVPITFITAFVQSAGSAPLETRRRYPLPLVLAPGERARLAVEVALPAAPSTYQVEFALVLDGGGYGESRARIDATLRRTP